MVTDSNYSVVIRIWAMEYSNLKGINIQKLESWLHAASFIFTAPLLVQIVINFRL
jgi:hypothetical protein